MPSITQEELLKIEKEMKKIIKRGFRITLKSIKSEGFPKLMNKEKNHIR